MKGFAKDNRYLRTALTRILGAPVIAGDDESTRVARLVHQIALAAIAVDVVVLAILPFALPRQNQPLILVAAAIASLVGILLLNRSGRVRSASALLTYGLWTITTFAAATSGGVHAPSFGTYTISILIAGLLLGWQAVAWICSLTIAAATAMLIAEHSHILPAARFPITSDSYLVALLVNVVLCGLLLGMALRSIERARARRQEELVERRDAESQLRQRETILAAIAQAARRLLEATDWRTEIDAMLALLGNASRASHAYLFENHFDQSGELLTSQRYEWVGANAKSELRNPDFQSVPVKEMEAMDWLALMRSAKPFYNSTRVFGEQWGSTRSRQSLKTLLDVPIFVEGEWWGIIGFDDEGREMPWFQAEVDAMQAAAGILGAAIERQQADEALRLSEDKFHTVFHTTNVPMVIGVMRNRTILEVNQAFCKFTGFSMHEALGHTGSELNLWSDASAYRQHREMLERDGSIRDFKARLRKKSGEPAVVLLSVTGIRVRGEECQLYTVYDITKLEELMVELQGKNTELEKFTYTVSHDLKAPLITIGGFVGYLERDIAGGNLAKVHQDIQRVMDAVHRMEQLLNELLELSRIGRIINDPEDISFAGIAEEAVRLVQGRLNANKVKVQIDAQLPLVRGDRARLVEVVQNLVDNGAKFMGEQSEPLIEIGAQIDGAEPVFFVRDNGIGILPEYHERVFGLFNKLDVNSEGTGIGLALAQRIIEFHGGKIWIESSMERKGTTFCFTLPLPQTADVDASR